MSPTRAVNSEHCTLQLRALLTVAVLLVATRGVRAHEPFEITADAHVSTESVSLHASMASRTASALCWGLGARPGDFERSDLEALPARFEACAAGLFKVESNGVLLAPKRVRVTLSAEHDFEASLDYPPVLLGPLRFEAVFLPRLRDPSYGVVLTAVAGEVFLGQALLRSDEPSLVVELPERAAQAAPAAPPPVAPPWEFLRLGVVHILTGYDHLAFLLGVLIACRTVRDALTLVTGFTLGHSLTLTAATLELVTLPSNVVEPLIAASVAFVGIETMLQREHTVARLPLTLAFGAVHGLGFAGALHELGLGANGASLVLPLLSFNLGVELGQALVGAPTFAALLALSRRPRWAKPARFGIGALLGTAGLYWLVERTLLSS